MSRIVILSPTWSNFNCYQLWLNLDGFNHFEDILGYSDDR